MPVSYAADMSNYGKELTKEEAKCFVNNNYKLIISGTQDTYYFLQQIKTAHEAGLAVHAYVYLNWGISKEQTLNALNIIKNTPVERLWLDCEAPAEGASATEIIEEIKKCIEISSSQIPVGIYTRYGWWTDVVNNTTEFSYLPLWNAYYDNDPDIDFYRLPYGGWTDVFIEQFGDTRIVCGQSIDVNVLNIKEARMLSDEEIKGLIGALLANQGRLGVDILINRNLINEIANAFFSHVQNHSETGTVMSISEIQKLINNVNTQIDELAKRMQTAANVITGGKNA